MESSPHSEHTRTLLGEPVTRPDGKIVSLYKVEGKVSVFVDAVGNDYTDDEVQFLGGGDWRDGLIRLAQSGIFGDDATDRWGRFRDFNDELIEAYQSGLLSS